MDVKSRMIGAALGAVLSFGIVSAGVAFAQEATDDPTTTEATPEPEATPEKDGCEDGRGRAGGGGEATTESESTVDTSDV